MPRQSIRFLRKGRIVELENVPAMRTVLDYLRLTEMSKGTKEGCNEGDCGACTVALGTLVDGKVVYEPVNACIMLLGQLEGKELITIDDLAQEGELHPLQRAFVDSHASQCGFCTPGFIMALFTLYHSGVKPTRQEIVDHVAGNLCRCTGYRPIVDAATQACTGAIADSWANDASAEFLAELQDENDIQIGDENAFFAAPATSDALAALYAAHPDATIVAGATDVGLWITKQLRLLPKIISVGRARGFDTIEDVPDHISIGAGTTYADAAPFLENIDPDIGEVIRRIGAKQVRASGTIGGNIANGSPIGDMPPMLIALGSTLHLRHGNGLRSMPLENFFLAYGKQDRRPGELVWRIDVPKLKPYEKFRSYKLSKRRDQDISAVMASFKFNLEGRKIVSARITFGGMAATPKRAVKTEAALRLASLDEPLTWDAALTALQDDYQPVADMRASAEYRMDMAKALLSRALIEISAGQTHPLRLAGAREQAV